MLRVVLVIAQLALTIYAVIDCIQTEDSQVRNLPKLIWILLILLFPIVGAVGWLFAGRTRPLRPPGFGPRRQPPRGPKGPEDDPDFLRKL